MKINKDCKSCIHNVLQAVICNTDRGEQLSWEPTCSAIKCIKGGKINGKYKSNIASRNSK